MSRDRLSETLHFFQRHKRAVFASVAGLLLLSAAAFFTVPLEHSLSLMLPSGSESLRMIRFLEELDFSGKVVFSISQKDETLSRAEFLTQVDAFAAELKPPLVTSVLSRMDTGGMIGDLQFFLQQTPALLDETDFQILEEKLSPAGVEKALRGKYLQLMRPEGSFISGMIRRDPLDIQNLLIERIQQVSASFGYVMKIEDQHIFCADGKHLLMVLETPVPFTDSKGSRELVDYLNAARERCLDSSIQADMICGHLHSFGNEKVIRRDIQWTMSITGVAFVLLFLLYFKDLRAALIFLIPFAAILVAISVAAFFMGALSPMILGFSAVIAGISVDYGIHIYVAVRRARCAVEAVRSIVRPLMLGALTTAAVFAAFFFTRIEGYRQLAVLALISIFTALAIALFVLPLLIRSQAERPSVVSQRSTGLPPRIVAALFFLLLAASIPAALRIRFDGDIARLDGSGKEVVASEERFRTVWGGGGQGQAVLAVSGPDLETALEKNDQFYSAAIRKTGRAGLSSFSPVWKSAAQRARNSSHWKNFWSPERTQGLQQLFAEKGRAFGFSGDAFSPFFESLQKPFVPLEIPADNQLFNQLKSRFVQQKNGVTQVVTFFPDTREQLAALAPLAAEIPGSQLVSRRELSRRLTQDYTVEMTRVAIIAAALMLAATFLMLRNIRMSLTALAPAFAGVLGMLGVMGLFGIEMNVVNLIAAIVVTGLCIDYGVFYTYAYVRELDTGTAEAVTLSAGTTIIGAGALLFAQHPALFSIGLTLVSGVLAGYLTALLAVPALCRIFLKKQDAS